MSETNEHRVKPELKLRIQNLHSNGNFPRTRKRETQDVVSWSAPETVLRPMDMAGHFTIVYCLQVYLRGGKEIKQIWMEFRILIWKSKVFDVSRIWFLIWIVILLSRLLFLIFHYFLPVWKSVVIWLGEKLGGKKSRKKVVMSAEMQGSVKQLVWKRINHLSWN